VLQEGLGDEEARRVDQQGRIGVMVSQLLLGLSTMVAVGPERFAEMLAGFHAMDEHFRTAPLARNLPVLMGLLVLAG
jgi:glucose-6-phosphate isomerase